MPVPEVEEVATNLKVDSLCDAEALGNRYILIVVAQSPQVRNPGTHAVIEVKPVCRLKRRDIKKRLVRIEIALVLSKWVGPRQDSWNTSHPKLARDVTLAAPEEERSAGGGPKNCTEPPSSQHRVHKGVGLRQPALALANGKVVYQRQDQRLRHIIGG